jgi:histidyl-tRNA synthetase
VTVVGEDERTQGVVTVKNLATGEQQSVARADTAVLIKGHLRTTVAS